MKNLFDHGTPSPLRSHLGEHSVDRSYERGWELLENGDLIRKAEEQGYEVIVRDLTDKHISYFSDIRLRTPLRARSEDCDPIWRPFNFYSESLLS